MIILNTFYFYTYVQNSRQKEIKFIYFVIMSNFIKHLL